MKKFMFLILSILLGLVCFCTNQNNLYSLKCMEAKYPIISIVIDDFGGYNRHGIDKMLSIQCPLTCAIMPMLPYSQIDAENAHKNGHEVILHMPMEADVYIPNSWYGNRLIRNDFTGEQAQNMVTECLNSIPHCKGMNFHIGSLVSTNENIMKPIMEIVKEKNMYLLDSKTSQKTVCPRLAKEINVKFASRDFFLEKTGQKSYGFAKNTIQKSVELSKKQGYSVVIGHVGAEGGEQTAQAICDMVTEIEKQGVTIVPLSQLIENINKLS